MTHVMRVGRPFLYALVGVCGLLLGAAFLRGGQGTSNRAPPAGSYDIIDLGTFGGFSSVALGINDQGQVVGGADTAQGLRHACLWENGVMTDLGTLGFPTAQSEAWDINNHGVVVGIVGGGDPNRAFLWENGVQTEIGPPQILKSALGINDAGQVVGIFVGPSIGHQHAFLWENGTLTDLGTLGGIYSIAWDINTSGQVAGSSFIKGGGEHAFLWENGAMTDLGNLGSGSSEAFAINDLGQVVGWAQRDPGSKLYHAFLWKDGVMTDLGALGGFPVSSAEAINNDGIVVGSPAFLYDPRLGIRNLQDLIPPESGWSGLGPRAINDLGWIAGVGTNPAGFRHAFLMTPTSLIPTISEYGAVVMTLLILTCGTILLRGRRAAR